MRPMQLRDESGAEALQFALVAPMLFALIFALIFGLLTVAANVSLGHAASVAVRYATLPIDPVAGTYPTTGQVEERLAASTPFFGVDSCDTEVTGDEIPNAAVALEVACDFPNPAGAALASIRSAFWGADDGASSGSVSMTASARGRRE